MTFSTFWVVAALSAAPDAVLLQFSSDHCSPCRAMAPAVSKLVSDGYPVQRIDVDRYPEVAKQFNIRGVPAFVLVAGQQEIARVEGATSYERLAGMFAQVRQPSLPLPLGEGRGEGVAPAGLQPTDYRDQNAADAASRAALAASVRLKVEDATGFGYGTGTIIDVHDAEALVVTCGHIFRESQGKGRISVDLFAPGASQPVEGQLIACDLDRDIALVSIRPGIAITAARVAPPETTVRPRDPVFSIGCDKGADASVRVSHITAVNKYRGKPNFTAAGAPIDGRSGGGLFTAEGLLIGICNAADPADDEGLYAALASIHWQLDQIGQSEVYQRSARGAQVAAAPAAAGQVAATPVSYSQPAEPARIPATEPPPAAAPQAAAPLSVSELTALPAVGGGDTELVVILRSKRNPTERSEIYVVDQASPELLANIVQAARRRASEQATLAQHLNRQSPQPVGPAGASRQPVVRGQFGD
jgi:thiol-disulfide isomerase/thioredoxin